MKKNIKFSESSILLLYYSFCLSLRASLWVRVAAISYNVIANFRRKCVNLIIPLYLSSFAFVLFFPTLIVHTLTIRYSYKAICILLLTNILLSLHLCHSSTLFVIFAPIFNSHSIYFIPTQAGIYLFLSLRALIYQGVAISFSSIIQLFYLFPL